MPNAVSDTMTNSPDSPSSASAIRSAKCAFQFKDGMPCRRWANRGSRFCNDHLPRFPISAAQFKKVHPLAKLTTPDDLFDVIRETLNAARQGRIAPNQAYAVGYLAKIWMAIFPQTNHYLRDQALYQQMLPTLVDAEAAAQLELDHRSMPEPVKAEAAPGAAVFADGPLPVAVDEEASTDAPPLPRTAAEAEAQFRELMASTPPAPREPVESYPGFLELEERGRAARAALRNRTLTPLAAPSEISPFESEIPPRAPSEISELTSAIPVPSRAASEISDLKSEIASPPRDSHPRTAPAPAAPLASLAEAAAAVLADFSSEISNSKPEIASPPRHSPARAPKPDKPSPADADRGNGKRANAGPAADGERPGNNKRGVNGKRGNNSLDETLTRAILKHLFRPPNRNNSS